MALVEQAIEVRAMPPKADVDRGAEDCRDPDQPSDGNVRQMASLHVRDRPARNAAQGRDVDLPEPTPESQRPKGSSDPQPLHPVNHASVRFTAA